MFVKGLKKMNMRLYIILIFFIISTLGYSQSKTDSTFVSTAKTNTGGDDFEIKKMKIKGKVYSVLITENDTMVIADLDYINISSMRLFRNDFEKRKYYSFKKKSRKVYDYAQEAIQIYKEYEYAKSQDMSKRALKKEINRLEDELKDKFESKLKKLTKLEGKIMVKMIEKETGQTMYQIIKDIRGRFTAFYWHNFSKLYSYDLKEGYKKGAYPIFDGVINDVTFEKVVIKNNENLKYIKLK